MKVCTECARKKPEEAFQPGPGGTCKDCVYGETPKPAERTAAALEQIVFALESIAVDLEYIRRDGLQTWGAKLS